MKTIHIISGILLFLLIAVSSASASPYDITITNGGPTVSIGVTYDQTSGLLTFTDSTPNNPNGGIIGIAYNANVAAQGITDGNGNNILTGKKAWVLTGGAQGYAGGYFGDFEFMTTYGKTGAVKYKIVKVQLPANTQLTQNNLGNYVAVHYNYNGATYFASHSKTPPTPPTPKLSIVKQVSSDGATWHDDTITVVAGSNVYYKFIVTNNGDVDLSGITLTDNPALAFKGTIPTTLAKGGSFTVTAGPITAVTGEQTDTATATGTYNGQTLTVTDTATYIGTKNTQVPRIPLNGTASCCNTRIDVYSTA